MENLKLALEAVYLNELENLPRESELESKVNISPEFEHKMKTLLCSQPAIISSRRVKRMLLVAVIAALMASAMSIQAIREPIARFFLDIYEICTDIIFQRSEDISVEEYEFFSPELPEEYVEISREELETQFKLEYSTEEGLYLRYTQYLLDGITLSVDTENIDYNLDQIMGNDVFLYSNKGMNSIVWSDGVFGYKLNVTCSIPEMLDIAKTIMEEIK